MFIYNGDFNNLKNDGWLTDKTKLRKTVISTDRADRGIIVFNENEIYVGNLQGKGLFKTTSTLMDKFVLVANDTDKIQYKNAHVLYKNDTNLFFYYPKNEMFLKSNTTEEDYGLANSVRLAFAQIGRVASATADVSDIVSMVCKPTNTGGEEGSTFPQKGEQTSLCDETKTTIWEPNDTEHNAKLIEYFNRVCKGKKVEDGEDGTKIVTYGADEEIKCIELAQGTATNTYVVNKDITSTDNVDVYDGLNGFEIDELEDYKISKYETFTDTHKGLKDEERPAFFKLAANSVTKIRVYVYLEGQDVDNYDLISLGKKIKINFGFTKDQFDLSNPTEENTETTE